MIKVYSALDLISKNYSEQDILQLIMHTENNCFIKELQESKQTYSLRIKIFPNTVLLFFDDDEYIGYLTAEFLKKIPTSLEEISFNHVPDSFTNTKNCFLYISSFAIEPMFRGNNYGSITFAMAEEYFCNLGIKKYVLLVNQEWKKALHIYTKKDYIIINTFVNAFPPEQSSNNSNGLLMYKEVR